jgi:hypothetical protein
MAEHASAPVGQIHVPYQWSYADTTAREAASGFSAGDVGKLCRQEDNNTLWILSDDDPVTWVAVGGSGGGAPTTASYVTTASDGDLSSAVVVPQLAMYDPDTPPASPGAYDDEFTDGSISGDWTCPANDASFSLPQTNGAIHLSESIMKGHFLMQGQFGTDGAYTLYKAFTPSASQAFTVVAKVHADCAHTGDQFGFEFGIRMDDDTKYFEVRCPNYYNSIFGPRWLINGNGGQLATAWDLGAWYIMISHDGSKNFSAYVSGNGINWMQIVSQQAVSFNNFTRLSLSSKPANSTRNPIVAVDFVRYFTSSLQYVIGKSI